MESREKWASPYFNDQKGSWPDRGWPIRTPYCWAATYQEFEAYWPNQTSDVQFADYLNSTPKLVVSRTLKTVEWQNSRLIKGDVVQELNGPNRRGRRKAPLRKRRRSCGSEARGCAALQHRHR